MTTTPGERHRYAMAPLIRFTLLTLYGALVLPLPLLAQADWQPWLWAAVASGWIVVVALTSERVILDSEGLQVAHPRWCAWCLRRGWHLPWSRVAGLTPVATSQGGRVFYVRARGGGAEGEGRAFLLPQRVERFDDFLARFSALSGLSTEAVARISPPWTYQLLAAMSVVLLAGEGLALAAHR